MNARGSPDQLCTQLTDARDAAGTDHGFSADHYQVVEGEALLNALQMSVARHELVLGDLERMSSDGGTFAFIDRRAIEDSVMLVTSTTGN